MVWDYRIVHVQEADWDGYEVREVYYENDRPYGHCRADLINEASEGVEGIRRVLKMMEGALEEPVLEAEDFKEEERECE